MEQSEDNDVHLQGDKEVQLNLRELVLKKDEVIQSLQSENEGLKQQIVEKDRFILSLQSEKESLRQQIVEKDRFIQSLQSEKESLRQQIATLTQHTQRDTLQPQSKLSYQSKFWEVPRKEVSLNMQLLVTWTSEIEE